MKAASARKSTHSVRIKRYCSDTVHRGVKGGKHLVDGNVSSLLKDMVGQGKILRWEGFWSGPYMISGEAGGRRGPLGPAGNTGPRTRE